MVRKVCETLTTPLGVALHSTTLACVPVERPIFLSLLMMPSLEDTWGGLSLLSDLEACGGRLLMMTSYDNALKRRSLIFVDWVLMPFLNDSWGGP